jgi:putative PIG3 family NAD(P)H quinone oxidoreductase
VRGIVVGNPGRDYKLTWARCPRPRPAQGQVLLEVAAAGVNRADLLQARGAYPPPEGASPLLGLECAGTVAELGPGVEGWAVGDRAAALLPGGGYAQYAVADSACLLPVPPGLDFAAAAAAPESACTVWSNLVEAGYRPGAALLVHGGAGGIGTMAVKLGAAMGSPVFATAGSPQRARVCEALGARRGIDYKSEDFAAVVLEGTAGAGVEVILDVVGAAYLERNLAALAAGGTLAVIGLMGGSRASLDLGRMLGRRHRIMATSLRGRTRQDKARVVGQVRRDIWDLVAAGPSAPAAPVVGAHFPLPDAAAAHQAMKSGAVVGKIVLTSGR